MLFSTWDQSILHKFWFEMSVCNNLSADFFCGKGNLLSGQFGAMGRFKLLVGQNNLLGGQLPGGNCPPRLTCFYLPEAL